MNAIALKPLSDRYHWAAQGRWAILLVPTHRCFSIPVAAEPPRSRSQQTAALYKLEAELFVDAEDVALDFVPARDGSMALVGRLSEITQRLEQAAKDFEPATCLAVTPDSLLVASAAVQPRGSDLQRVLIARDEWLEILDFSGHRLESWSVEPWDRSELIDGILSEPTSRVAADASEPAPNREIDEEGREDQGRSIHVVRMPGGSTESRSAHADRVPAVDNETQAAAVLEKWEANHDSQDGWELLADASKQILAGQSEPPANLSSLHSTLAQPTAPLRSSLQLLAACAVLLTICLVGGMVFRAYQYRAATAQLVEQQEQVFEELFPKQRVPVGILGRIESEFRRLRVTRSDATSLDESVLPVLLAFLKSVPAEPRFQVQRLTFRKDRMDQLAGNVIGIEELEEVRAFFSQQGFELPPISASSTGAGVSVDWTDIEWNPSTPSSEPTSDTGVKTAGLPSSRQEAGYE